MILEIPRLFLKMKFLKNVLNKNWCAKLIFLNEKVSDDFWHRRMTLKVRTLQFSESMYFVRKCPTKNQCNFCDQWSISLIVISFLQSNKFLSHSVDLMKILPMGSLIKRIWLIKTYCIILKRNQSNPLKQGFVVSSKWKLTIVHFWTLAVVCTAINFHR